MRKVKIVTDSTADLSAELVERYDVDIVPPGGSSWRG